MNADQQQAVEFALRTYRDPYVQHSLYEFNAVRHVDIVNNILTLDLVMGYPLADYRDTLLSRLKAVLQSIPGVTHSEITCSVNIIPHAVQKPLKHKDGIKNIIAVASGKGGVGKSTVSANLALALRAEGACVGLLDADIYGPSQPRMLGMEGKPDSLDGKSFEPKTPHGIQAMSIGLLVDDDTPMIWRGPMVTSALQQLLNETRWRDLDYLIVDLPPGTGDIQLTLAQKIPVAGAVIVTTPQDIALLDARKALKMFEKVDVHVLGVIENMSTHICSQCGHEESIFGRGGGQRMAEDYTIELLGTLPLDIHIREHADSGRPSVIADPEGPVSTIYREIARNLAARLALRPKDYAAVFPGIKVE